MTTAERHALVAGYADCYAYEVRRNSDFNQPTASVIQALGRPPRARDDTLEAIAPRLNYLLTRASIHYNRQSHQGGEVWTGKHGFYDGDYWHQLSPTEREAFVRGYYACKVYAHRRHPTTNPDHLKALASKWFGTSDHDVSALDDSRADSKIGDFLDRYFK